MKSNITLCVNAEIKQWFQGKSYNMSEICSSALAGFIAEQEGKPVEQRTELKKPKPLKSVATNYPLFERDIKACVLYIRQNGDTVKNYSLLLNGMQEKWNISSKTFKNYMKQFKEAPSAHKTDTNTSGGMLD